MRVEPVKLRTRTKGSAVKAPPMATASPVTIENRPAGRPARSPSTASAIAENGVCGAGFSTKPQPAARAGPALRVTMAFGKFKA